MTKSQLIISVAENNGLSKQAATQAVELVFEDLAKALARGERTEIRSFGVFESRARKPRAARNPKTGEKVDVQAKTAVHFKPGLEMRKRVDHRS
uniref:Integration host factor subunit beta n=1 Tax=Magnetococcus massalia (strain MO-1) TaxID=451514 RepID=A0A1S7LGG9_MAGMO|nr:Integration host factor subunit beta [Candidatus Magnetococcus massalia]